MVLVKDSQMLKLGMSKLVSSTRIKDARFLRFCHSAAQRISNLTMETSASPPFSLLGPPELYPFSVPAEQKPAQGQETINNDPFMKSMVANFNNLPPRITPNNTGYSYGGTWNIGRGYTENHSPTFLSSGNACLDFFFHVVPDTPDTEVVRRLQLAWEQDPLTALKLVCNLRGVRGTGKSDRDGFYASALWLHQNHPKTLAENADALQEFGYFKDLPEILYRLLNGADVRKIAAKQPRKWIKLDTTWGERRVAAAKKGLERYMNDPVYQYLHDKISDVFAKHLKSDLENLKSGKPKLSLAAKWCPSLNSPFDNSTLLCESIARRLFPRDQFPEYDGIEEAHYAYRIRDRLRKEYLSPLRKALELPEIYISDRNWNVLPYERVASVAMKNYRESFFEHDKERFKEFLGEVKKGTKKIAAGALLPHEIVSSLMEKYGGGYGYYHYSSYDKVVIDEGDEVLVLQWQRMVEDLSANGKLTNCLAICDVSDSMHGVPLEVSIALGLLVSDLSEEPWKGKLITFSQNPQLQIITGDDLIAKIRCVNSMHWEMNTDFQKVFDRILEVAKEQKLTEDQMIKRLFVFSDMEFDEASSRPWETDYEAITRKYHEAGYTSVPEIVFWNLRNSKATPVPSHQKGVALVSGFSKNMLKVFLDKGGIVNPEDSMKKAISGEEYQKLVVVD